MKKTLFGAAVIFPFAYLLLWSVAGRWAYPDLLPEGWTGAHWRANTDLGGSLLRSLGLSLLVATAATSTGFWLSRTLSYHTGRQIWFRLAYLPYTLSPVILAACWQYFFIRGGLSGNWLGVSLAQFLIAFPYAVILFGSFWNLRLQSMEQAAYTLGSPPGHTFRRVLLPLARGPLLLCFFQTFLISWYEYGLTSLIGVGQVQTLPVKVYQYINEANPYWAALAGCLLSLPPLVLLWVNKRFLFTEKWTAYGG